jgi:class 3 adenylate cyclase
MCLFTEALEPFRDCQRSLDGNASTMVVNLARIYKPAEIDPTLGAMFGLLGRPAYMLALATAKRGMLFLRDEIGTSEAAVLVFNLQNISEVYITRDGQYANVEIETPQDFIKLPLMMSEDADDALNFLRTRSVDAIEASEEFIDRDFEKELKKLDMLFKAKALKSSEYHFRKSRLQKMELEKFSDANIELLLTRRFSEGSKGDRFDEQLLKKFTFEKTVMFTDIVGFSSQASQKMLLDTMTLLAVHDKLLMPVLKQYEGTLIKKIGDALMVRFDDPFKACQAAQEMQSRLFEFNQKNEDKIFIRIGINTGTVFVKNEDVFGDAVNIAARMESLARPGRIFITETTMQRLEARLPAENLGPQKVKGKTEPVIVYSLIDKTNQADEMASLANDFLQTTGLQASGGDVAAASQETAKEGSIKESRSLPTLPDLQMPVETPVNAAPDHSPEAADDLANSHQTPPDTFPENFLNAVDYARHCYIDAVKEGRMRNPDLEDWFARFEALLRPDIQG